MSWTADERREVGRAVLGSWPSGAGGQGWGQNGIAAYVRELEARGLGASRTLLAIRSWPAGSDFPPSAPNIAARARRDVSTPTFDECYRLIYGRNGILRARPPYPGRALRPADFDEARRRKLSEVHPLVRSFVERHGLARLQALEVEDPEFGELRRKELRASYEQHRAVFEERGAVALASGGRDGLRSLDPLSAIGGPRRELTMTSDEVNR